MKSYISLTALLVSLAGTHCEEQVKLTIWTTPNSDWHNDLMNSAREITTPLESGKLLFEPQYYIHDGSHACRDVGDEGNLTLTAECQKNCVNYGRFCQVPGGDDDPKYNLNGADIVLESARRQCIWQLAEAYDVPEMFFNYLEELEYSDCDAALTPDCLEAVYNQIYVDKKEVERCMFGSAEFLLDRTTNDDVENTLLQGQIDLAQHTPVTDIPQVFINGKLLTDTDLSTASILKAVCEAYDEGSAPTECSLCLDANCAADVSTCLATLTCESAEEQQEANDNPASENYPLEAGATSQNIDSTLEESMEDNTTPSSTHELHDLQSGFGKFTDFVAPRDIFTYQMIQNCEVDFRTPGPLVEAILAGDRDAFVSGSEVCTNQGEEEFTGACQSFEQCAGFDFLEFALSNSQALGQSFFGCLDAFESLSEKDVAVERCVSLAFNTGLWRSLGHFLEYNEQICPCVEPLQNSLPNCMFQQSESEIILDGPAVKLSACLLGQVCNTLEPLCRSEVGNLDQCLPALDTDEECTIVEEKCGQEGALLFLAPFPMAGATFPDRCQGAAAQGDYLQNAHVIERYNKYRRKCVLKDEDLEDVKEFGDPEEQKDIDDEEEESDGEKEDFQTEIKILETETVSWLSQAYDSWMELDLLTRILAASVVVLSFACLAATLYAFQHAKRRYRLYSQMQMQTLGDEVNFHDQPQEKFKPFRDKPDVVDRGVTEKDETEDEDAFFDAKEKNVKASVSQHLAELNDGSVYGGRGIF